MKSFTLKKDLKKNCKDIMKFNALENVDISTQNLISGFIKEIQKLLPNITYYNIPELVHKICLLFYHIPEYWDPKHVSSNFSVDGDQAVTKKSGVGSYESAYLFNVVSTGIHHWKFKIVNKVQGYSNIDIGIWNVSSGQPNTANYFSYNKNGYAYSTTNGALEGLAVSHTNYRYGKRCKTGDDIDMFVDFNKLELKYNVNGKDQGVAFTINNSKYRAAISLYYVKDCVQLLFYEQMQPTK